MLKKTVGYLKTKGVSILIASLILCVILAAGTYLSRQSSPTDRIQPGADLVSQGYSHYLRNHYKEAADSFEQAAKDKPDSEPIWYDLGNAYFQQGLFNQACTAYQKALALNSKDGDAIANLRLAQDREKKGMRREKVPGPNEMATPSPETKPKKFWEDFFTKLNDSLRQ
jgi:tetratricopeptide (TPR) repeat protein